MIYIVNGTMSGRGEPEMHHMAVFYPTKERARDAATMLDRWFPIVKNLGELEFTRFIFPQAGEC